MNLKFLRQIRLAGFVVSIIGFFAHNIVLVMTGTVLWMSALLISYGMIENMVIRNLERIEEENKEQSDEASKE